MPDRLMHSPVQANAAARGIGLRLRRVRRVFDAAVEAVAPLDLDIGAGEFVALLGPSGCGKSTLLRMVAQLDQPTQGTIRQVSSLKALLADEAHAAEMIPRNSPGEVGYVFQDAHLLPWRTVLGNVMLPLELGRPRRSRRAGGDCLARAQAVLKQVGLQDALTRYPAQLSGGMKMRVSLARALVTEPALLLLDEPFAALDEITRHSLDEQLRALWLQRGMTVLFVTHSLHEAAFLAQRALVFSRRPARVVLDHVLDLPLERDGYLRTTAGFAAQTRVLYEALVRGEALA